MSNINNYMSVQDFARRADVSEQAIRKAIAEKRVKADKIGRQWLLTKSELKKYMTVSRG
jgi:excisionase family DNA binding protein